MACSAVSERSSRSALAMTRGVVAVAAGSGVGQSVCKHRTISALYLALSKESACVASLSLFRRSFCRLAWAGHTVLVEFVFMCFGEPPEFSHNLVSFHSPAGVNDRPYRVECRMLFHAARKAHPAATALATTAGQCTVLVAQAQVLLGIARLGG